MGLRSKVTGRVPCGVERDWGWGGGGGNALSEGPEDAQVWWLKQQEKDCGEGEPRAPVHPQDFLDALCPQRAPL